LVYKEIFYALLEFAIICRELNSKRDNPAKLVRSEIIINWLKNLSDVPSREEKLTLSNDIKEALSALKAARSN